MTKDSWLFKHKDKSLRALIWVMEGHDNSVDNINDTTTQEWNKYYLLNLSKGKIDTLKIDEKVLEKDFRSLIQKLTKHKL